VKTNAAESTFSENLLRWFDQHGRKDLPWQHNKSPYRVWVSEIMLQQTQVSSVIAYYQQFMARFPTLEVLAEAKDDDVLEHWAGLGYYARARNLLKSAKIIQSQFNGSFPNTLEEIITLPGIGRSTAGAILSIAFQQHAPILDGNVKRVLCRYQAIKTWHGDKQIEKQLWELATKLTPSTRAGDYTQAIMDLGATLCTRSKPSCLSCPMSAGCQSFALELQNEIPKSRPKKTLPLKQTWLAHIQSDDDEVLLEKRPPSGIWGGLYSLPELDSNMALKHIAEHCANTFSFDCISAEEKAAFTHTFSHFKLNLKPVRLTAKRIANQVNDNTSYRWVKTSALKQFGMPSPISKYLANALHPSTTLPIK